jgi:hypothetical protein
LEEKSVKLKTILCPRLILLYNVLISLKTLLQKPAFSLLCTSVPDPDPNPDPPDPHVFGPPDPLVTGMDPAPYPDSLIIKQK